MFGLMRSRGRVGGRLFASCWWGLCLAVWAAHSVAAPAPQVKKGKPVVETVEQKAARLKLEHGRELLAQGDATGALGALSAARELNDSLDVELAIADATVRSGRPLEAQAALSAFVAQHRTAWTTEQVARAEGKLLEAREASAQLSLDVSELGTEIQLDGTTIGTSPLPGPLPVNPGAHRLALTKPGFLPASRDVMLTRGLNALRVSLAAEVATGTLRVTSEAKGVIELLIDHRVVGLLPWEGTLPVGPATLSARTSDQSSLPVQVVVEKDVVKPVTLALSQNLGLIDVRTAVPTVRILLDGRAVGVGAWRGTAPPGVHHLEFQRDGFVSQGEDVAVTTGGSFSVVVGNWVPLSVPQERARPADDQGLYVRLDLAGAFGATSDGVSRHCAEPETNAPARCASSGPYGGGLGLRVGYRFKWVAPEVFGLGTLSVAYVRATFDQVTLAGEDPFYGPPRREDYAFFRYGWAAGAGVRFSTPASGIAATGGLGLGVFSQSAEYVRTTTGSSLVSTPIGTQTVPLPPQSHTSNVVHRYSPGLVFDAGLLLGASPGTKLYLGVMASVEFAAKHARTNAVTGGLGTNADGKVNEYGTPRLDVVSGTQFTFGPVLGFQFGY